MRRLIALMAVAAVGAFVFGVSGASSGLRVGAATVSASTMRAELAAIQASRPLQCYLTALAQQSFSPGSGGATLSASGAAAWTGLRVEGLAVEQYVAARFGARPSAAAVAAQAPLLESQLAQAAQASSLSCPGSPAVALAAMTPEMRTAQLRAEAASVVLSSHLGAYIATTTASLRAYYAQHPTQYDTLCVSAAVVPPSQIAAFQAMEKTGASIAALVARFSIDPQSKAAGGAIGCFAPSNQVYATVRSDLVNTTIGAFASSPVQINYGGTTMALFVTATKVTPTPFASAAPRVLADVTALDTTSATSAKEQILYRAHVSIDPSLGRWGLSSSGPGVFSPGTPAASDVTGASILAGTHGATYK